MERIRGFARRNWPVLIVALVVLAGRSSLADHYVVPSGSMENTLIPGDRVMVDKTAYGLRIPFTSLVLRSGDEPSAGEVVIFDSPEDGTRLIKRVVAVGGDHVELRAGHLTVNGAPLAKEGVVGLEQIGDAQIALNLKFGGGPDITSLVIPEGHVLVLGDARGNSRDSRYFGVVQSSQLYARAFNIYFRSGDGFVWLPL